MINWNKLNIEINTKKITLLGAIIGLYILLSWISQIMNLRIFFIAPFLKIEFTEFICLLLIKIINIIYSSLFIIIILFCRIIYLNNGIIDIFSLILSNLLFMYIFFLCDFLLQKILISNTNNKKKIFIIIISVIISIFITSFLMAFFNWLFLYDIYIKFTMVPLNNISVFKYILIIIITIFNFIKFSINGILFIKIYKNFF